MVRMGEGTFPYYTFENLSACAGTLHFVSSGERNIGFACGEQPEQVVANRTELAYSVGFGPECLVVGNQVHGVDVTLVTGEDAGKGALDNESRLPGTDALITDKENVCLMVLTADCVPVLLLDPRKRVIAAVHAGWRGAAGNIAGKAVRLMRERFGCDPRNILAGIGPSIGACCFEVSGEVAEAFRLPYPAVVTDGGQSGKYQVDLWEVNRLQLLGEGLENEHIECAGICTMCHSHEFFSYRRDGLAAGRFGSGIMLCGK